MTRPQHVTSIRGIRYRLGRELGRGGQGAVFAVEGERLAVKLLCGGPHLRELLRDQLAMVARLPLEGLAVAQPIDQLRPPHVGYVMELFTGMAPLRSLLRPPKGVGSVTKWYLDGGGLGRRLRLLAHIAQAISALHGRALVYTDLSPNNVFVSESASDCEVRLIDVDNLHVTTATGRSVYTPRYGAPEVVRGTGLPSTLADAHAFAVLAFETLALAHPLLGDAVRDGEPELEDRALAGELPWIDAPDDDGNQSSDGIPRGFVLSSILQRDFQTAFGPGLSNPDERPGMATWGEHLHVAADQTIICPSCRGSYFVNRDDCPWCGQARPDCVEAMATLWDPRHRHKTDEIGGIEATPGLATNANGKVRVLDRVVVSERHGCELTERVTHGASGNTPTLRVNFAQDRIALEGIGEVPMHLVSSGKSNHNLEGPVDVPIVNRRVGWHVHVGPSDQLHRVIYFNLRKGTA